MKYEIDWLEKKLNELNERLKAAVELEERRSKKVWYNTEDILIKCILPAYIEEAIKIYKKFFEIDLEE